MTKKFLIVLTDGEDQDIKLANAAAKAWIERDPRNSSGWTEKIPSAVLAGHEVEETTAHISIGSYENDRALQCPGEQFDCIVDLVKHCIANKIELVGEFHGLIY